MGDLVGVNQRPDRQVVAALRRVNQEREAVGRTLLVAPPPRVAADEQHEDGGGDDDAGDGQVAPEAPEATALALARLGLHARHVYDDAASPAAASRRLRHHSTSSPSTSSTRQRSAPSARRTRTRSPARTARDVRSISPRPPNASA